MVVPTRGRSNSSSNTSGSFHVNTSRSLYPQHHQNPLRTGPLFVGCVLLLAVPLSVFNIISTTSKSFTRSDDKLRSTTNDLPMTEHAWDTDIMNNQPQHIRPSDGDANPILSSSKYQGQSWVSATMSDTIDGFTSDSVIVAAETPLAKCEVYHHQTNGQDHIIFEEQDIIHVVVMDTQDRIWVLRYDSDSKDNQQQHSPYFAVPPVPSDNNHNKIIYSPVMGYNTKSNEAPWYAAHRIVAQILGILPKPTTIHTDSSTARVVYDTNGIKDGNIPKSITTENGPDSNSDSDDWIFLGRHRTMANRGGGFVYSYLLRNVPGSPNDTNASPETIALSKDDIQYALKHNQFADVRGIASIALALLYS